MTRGEAEAEGEIKAEVMEVKIFQVDLECTSIAQMETTTSGYVIIPT